MFYIGAAIAIFSGIIINIEKVAWQGLSLYLSLLLSLCHLLLTLVGILLTLSYAFLGLQLNDSLYYGFPDAFHSWSFFFLILSSITLLSFLLTTWDSIFFPNLTFLVFYERFNEIRISMSTQEMSASCSPSSLR